jgi:hypothetical protein
MGIGDCVCSNIIHTMIGKIVRLLNNDNAIVAIGNRENACWLKLLAQSKSIRLWGNKVIWKINMNL